VSTTETRRPSSGAQPPDEPPAEARQGWFRRTLPALFVLVVLGGLGGAGFYGYSVLVGTVDGPDEAAVAEAAAAVEDAIDPDALPAVRAVVSGSHAEMNEAVGFGRLESLDVVDFRNAYGDPITAQLNEVIDQVDHETLVLDLEATRDLLAIGVETDDRDALMWAHRVLHDLDYFAFNPDEEGAYYAATATLEGDLTDAHRYLATVR
jgi:hypothetical protein